MLRTLLALGAALVVPLSGARADNWPAWRGADGMGICAETDLPVRWSRDENVRWKVKLPGPGNSTPVVWGERVFLTQAGDRTMWPPQPASGGPAVAGRRSLLCLRRADGKTLWQKDVIYEEKELTHSTNPFCSASPATDGRCVVVSYGSAGVYCYDFDGQELWHRDLGKCEHIWGNAASPLLYGDLVILNFGPGERTFLIAMDRRTGKDVWKVEEPGGKSGTKGQSEWLGSWSTPTLLRLKDHDELIMTWPGIVKAYAPKTGELLWTCQGLGKDEGADRLVYTSPLVSAEAVVAMAGFGGPALAVRPGGKGDVTDSRLWRHRSAPQRIGSGVIVGEHVYMMNEPGTAECLELKTGKTVWSERVGPGAWGSLVRAGDRLYVTNVEGETLILAAKPKFEVVARNPLKEMTRASIAVSDGNMFIRTYEHLWCIGK